MAYRLFIFDFDGTLSDSLAWFSRNYNAIAVHHGLRTVDEQELQMLRGRSNTEIIRQLNVPMWKVPALAADMRARMAADVANIRLFDGVDEMLERLHAGGARIAIVTSNSEANVRAILGEGNARLVDHFDCGASMFGKARKLKRTMQQLRIGPRETMFIGDEVRDIEAARSAGTAAGAVAWGYATPEILAAHRPTVLFERMEQIGPTTPANPS